jgi:hypothetical protein
MATAAKFVQPIPISKNYDGYQFTRTKSTWKQNFPQIWGFLYFKKLRKLAKHQK